MKLVVIIICVTSPSISQNLEEIPRPGLRSRRGAVIEAPVASELFANTSLSKSESEFEKFMVL